ESDDGVRWEHVKTNDGRVLLKGVPGEAKATPKGGEPRYSATQAPPIGGVPGALVKPLGTMLIYDPHDVPERRYKFFQEINFMRVKVDGAGKPLADPRKLTG